MKKIFDPESLVAAIKELFIQNNYEIFGPKKIHGAEVDLVAKSKSDPFSPNVYIEATIEKVNTIKFGKDSTKFLLIKNIEPRSTLLLVSSSGFSLPVLERAKESGVEALLYDELFLRFQRFGSYIEEVIGSGDLKESLEKLNKIYEEAYFEDPYGKVIASKFLTNWKNDPETSNPWIVIVGDYGTGKTALTQVLLYRWMRDYYENPKLPIVFRIELRDFTRQFDARGLLHHFLDKNNLAHLPVEFVFSLISQGKIILLLDGYDEMAQYMHARERRVCLEALAELAKGGALGVITSRPNYFTEAEELNILDALYASIPKPKFRESQLIIEREKGLDELLGKYFLDRYERFLRDLDSEQTKSLVKRILRNRPEDQETILGILEMVFKSTESGETISLSGKPVIISYLLDVLDELKRTPFYLEDGGEGEELTEWQIFSLIIEKLMWRDYRRAPEILPEDRKEILKKISIKLSSPAFNTLSENDFLELVRKESEIKLKRVPSEMREQELQKIFADIRSSATLTRRNDGKSVGWRFSHNSLREFMVSDFLVDSIKRKNDKVSRISISDLMKSFVASISDKEKEILLDSLTEMWKNKFSGEVLGMYLSFLWDLGNRFFSDAKDSVKEFLERVSGRPISLIGLYFERINFNSNKFGSNLEGANFSGSSIYDGVFEKCNLMNANFSNCILEGVSFQEASLKNSTFSSSIISEVNICDADIEGADFKGVIDVKGLRTNTGKYDGEIALGYLSYHGGITDKVPPIFKCRHHPAFNIVEKIATKLLEQPVRQERGLVLRGAARKDTNTAKSFLTLLKNNGLVDKVASRELVKLSEKGRDILGTFVSGENLNLVLAEFFELD